jgi:uncharacterized protein (DUF1778 family)
MMDQKIWLMSDEQMEEFWALLNRAPKDCPKMKALFLRPSPFEEVS